MPETKFESKVIVCSAIRRKSDGLMFCGPRHGDCLNLAGRFVDVASANDTWELGFVDQDNQFLTRREAWSVADAAGQIRRPTGYELDYGSQRKPGVGDVGLLFSENLY